MLPSKLPRRFRQVIGILGLVSVLFGNSGVNISSLIFFDFTVDPSGSTTNSFNVTRTYLDFRKAFAKDMSLRITSDVGRTENDDRMVLYLKHGYLTWNTTPGIIQIGVHPTNYFGPTKSTWGYRFIEKFPTNRVGFGTTADLGISIQKEILPRLLLHLAVYNGGGHKKSENDSYKRTTLLLFYGEQTLNKKPGWNAGGAFSYEPYKVISSTAKETKVTTTVFAGFALPNFRLGGEYTILNNSGNENKRLLAVYSSFSLTRSVSLLFRGDKYDHGGDQETYVIAGININPRPGFSLAPNIRYTLTEASKRESNFTFMLNFQFKF